MASAQALSRRVSPVLPRPRINRPAKTDRVYRCITLCPIVQQNRMNIRVAQILDTGGTGDETFSTGISEDGSQPYDFFVAEMSLREADLDAYVDLVQHVPQSETWIWDERPQDGALKEILDTKFGSQANVEVTKKTFQELLDERGLVRQNPAPDV